MKFKTLLLASILCIVFTSTGSTQQQIPKENLALKPPVIQHLVHNPVINSVTPSYHGTYIKFIIGGNYFKNQQGTQEIYMLARRSSADKKLIVLNWSNTEIMCKITTSVQWEPWQKFYIYDPGNPPADGSMENSNLFVYVLKTKIYFKKKLPVLNPVSPIRNTRQPSFTIYGTMLGQLDYGKNVLVSGVEAPVVSWTNTKIVFRLPSLLNPLVKRTVYLKTYYEREFIFTNKLLLPK